MSQENVEVVRRAFEHGQHGGATRDALPVEVYAEDVEWDTLSSSRGSIGNRCRRVSDLADAPAMAGASAFKTPSAAPEMSRELGVSPC